MRRKNTTRGFTLLEVLIAVLILGIIATAAVPMIGDWAAEARAARLEANLKTLEKAVAAYELVHKAPWGFVYDPNDPELFKEVPGEDTSYLAAQMEMPTDIYGNVVGEPAGSVTGEAQLGPYLFEAFVPIPASVVLAEASKTKERPLTLPGIEVRRGDVRPGSPTTYLARYKLLKNGQGIRFDETLYNIEPNGKGGTTHKRIAEGSRWGDVITRLGVPMVQIGRDETWPDSRILDPVLKASEFNRVGTHTLDDRNIDGRGTSGLQRLAVITLIVAEKNPRFQTIIGWIGAQRLAQRMKTYTPLGWIPQNWKEKFGPQDPIHVEIGEEMFYQLRTPSPGLDLDAPNLPGVTVTIPPGIDVIFPEPRFAGGAPMSVEALPSQLPDGVFPPVMFGFGPTGAFLADPNKPQPTAPCTTDPPDPSCLRVGMTFPNVTDRPPGTVLRIYAPYFDQGRLVVIGNGEVSADRKSVRGDVCRVY